MTIEQLLRSLTLDHYAVRLTRAGSRRTEIWSVFYIQSIDFSEGYTAAYIGQLTLQEGVITGFSPNSNATYLHIDVIQKALSASPQPEIETMSQ